MAIRDAWHGFTGAFTGSLAHTPAQRMGGFSGTFFKHTVNAQSVLGKGFGAVADVLLAVPRLVREGAKPIAKASYHGSMAVGGTTGNVALAVAKKPVEGVLNIAAVGVRSVRRHPLLAGTAAVAGVLGVVAARANDSAERRTQEELMAQMQAAQQPMYQTTPEDYAAMQARMRDSMAGQGNATGHADRVMAAKQAQTEAAKPTADLAQL